MHLGSYAIRSIPFELFVFKVEIADSNRWSSVDNLGVLAVIKLTNHSLLMGCGEKMLDL